MSSSRIWLTSDPHFHHANLVRGGKIAIRPFDTVEEMHACLISRWNSVVHPQDHIYVLGDVTLSCKPRDLWPIALLHGHKRLILGNHDLMHVRDYLEGGFEKVMSYRVFGGREKRVLLSHIPIHPSQFTRFAANIHGHTHESYVSSTGLSTRSKDPRYINMCVEVRNYTPVLLDQVLAEEVE